MAVLMRRIIAAILVACLMAVGLHASPSEAATKVMQVPEYGNEYGTITGPGFSCYYSQTRPWTVALNMQYYLRSDALIQCSAVGSGYTLGSLWGQARFGQSTDGNSWSPYSTIEDVRVDDDGTYALSIYYNPSQDPCHLGAGSRYYRLRVEVDLAVNGPSGGRWHSWIMRRATSVKHNCGTSSGQ